MSLWAWPGLGGSFSGASGPALGRALNFVAPFAMGEAPWPHQQLDPFSMAELWDVYAGSAAGAGETRWADVAARLAAAPAADDARRLLWPPPAGPSPSPGPGLDSSVAAVLGSLGGVVVAGLAALGVRWARGGTVVRSGMGERAALLGRLGPG